MTLAAAGSQLPESTQDAQAKQEADGPAGAAGDLSALAGDVFQYRRDANLPKVQASSSSLPIVILPGFGNSFQDYNSPFGALADPLMLAILAICFQTQRHDPSLRLSP